MSEWPSMKARRIVGRDAANRLERETRSELTQSPRTRWLGLTRCSRFTMATRLVHGCSPASRSAPDCGRRICRGVAPHGITSRRQRRFGATGISDGAITVAVVAPALHGALQHVARATGLVARANLAILRVALEDARQFGEIVRILVDARRRGGVRREDGHRHGVYGRN